MKLIFSDIHASKKAAQDIESIAHRFDSIICAGDICGYNTDLEYTIDMLIGLDVKSVKGNHDAMVLDENYDMSRYSDFIIEPILWARENLTGRYRDYIEALPETREVDNVFVTHTFPDGGYVRSREDASLLLDATDKALIVVGHTHTRYLFEFGERSVMNPGSITHGRRGCARGYIILDEERVSFEELGGL